MKPDPVSFKCPICGAISYNPNDARERYCVRCHRFVDDPATPDLLTRTKADPNRSRREDQLVAEIERLRVENAQLRAAFLREPRYTHERSEGAVADGRRGSGYIAGIFDGGR